MDVTFDPSATRQNVKGVAIQIIDLSGRKHSWQPKFHVSALSLPPVTPVLTNFVQFQADLDKFMKFQNEVDDCQVDDQPPYITQKDLSFIDVVPHANYEAMSVKDVQTLLRRKHIVVPDIPIKPLTFDEEGLQELTNMDAKVHVQGEFTLMTSALSSWP
jgi:hypothetical protein